MNPQSSYGPAKEKTRDAGGQHLAFRFFPLSGSSTSFNEASFNEAQLGWSQLFPPQPLPVPQSVIRPAYDRYSNKERDTFCLRRRSIVVASIWRIRSRVSPNILPTSSSVWTWSSYSP